MSDRARFVPAGFEPPVRLELPEFVLEPLEPPAQRRGLRGVDIVLWRAVSVWLRHRWPFERPWYAPRA